MAIRLYSLAKDLGMDSKQLADYCATIGIFNKGSALATLEDNEIEQIRTSLRTLPDLTAGSHSIRSVVGNPTTVKTTTTLPPVERFRPIRPAGVPLALPSALGIDSLHAQAMELGSIVESLILRILNTTDASPQFQSESNFCKLIDDAHDGNVFASVSTNSLHSARIVRNRIVHRGNGDFPSDREIRDSRNTFVLAILDLLEHCGETLKAEILSEYTSTVRRAKNSTEVANSRIPEN